jgi:hypothetical protein
MISIRLLTKRAFIKAIAAAHYDDRDFSTLSRWRE